MNELVSQTIQLPETIEDISKFVLVGREKLTAVRAEIRAIDKLELAEEVRNQKLDEARMLSEAVLDAEVKLGDLLKQIPKRTSNQHISDMKRDSGVVPEKPKKEVVKELGFSPKQAERFETLADNKDLVEKVKEEARENDDIPTRTRVIDLAQQRKKKEREKAEQEENFSAYIDECKKTASKFTDAVYAFIHIQTDPKSLKMWGELMEPSIVPSLLQETEEAMAKLSAIRNFLKGVKK